MTKYPEPSPNRKPNFTKTPENDVLDIGWTTKQMRDGRTVRAELWCQDLMDVVTFRFSKIGLELLEEREIARLLEEEELVKFLTPEPQITPVKFMEDNGNDLWSVSVVLFVEEEQVNESPLLFRGYDKSSPRSDTQPALDTTIPDIFRAARGRLLYQWMVERQAYDPVYGRNPEISILEPDEAAAVERQLNFDTENAWLVQVHPRDPAARAGYRIIGVSKTDFSVLGEETIPVSEPGTTPSDDLLEWEDLEDIAPRVFNIWYLNEREVAWAKNAWTLLRNAGLTRYDFELERARAYIRFLTLASLWHRWCHLVHREGDECVPYPSEWNDKMRIDPFYIGQLVGEDFVAEDNDSPVDAAMRLLVEEERPAVVKALKDGFAGESGLFVSLWQVNSDEDDQAALSSLTPDKGVGFEWITNGCPI